MKHHGLDSLVLNALNLSILELGFLLTTFPAGFVIGAPVGGWLAARLTPIRALLAAQSFVVVGAITMLQLNIDSTVLAFALVTFLVGLGRGFYLAPYNTFCMNVLPVFQLGRGGSLIAFVRNLGMMVGTVMAGGILAAAVPELPVPSLFERSAPEPSFMEATHMILAGSAIAATVSAGCFILLNRLSGQRADYR